MLRIGDFSKLFRISIRMLRHYDGWNSFYRIAVKGSYKNTENVVFKTVPAVEIASATYKGSYEQMPAVNHAVATWVEDNGYEFNDLTFCIYHVSPNQTQNPDEYVTEACYSVKKK